MNTRWLNLVGIMLAGAVLAMVAGAVLALGSPSQSSGQVVSKPSPKWEYKEVAEDKLADEGGLNKLGDQNWELINVEPKLPYLTRTNPGGLTTVEYTKRIYYFKRQKD